MQILPWGERGLRFVDSQELVDEQSRVHCSLNLNTETGRLSARRPNLQNQPALEKDQYKIRVCVAENEQFKKGGY